MNKNITVNIQISSILTIGEVAERLKLKKPESAMIWLNENGVEIHKLNRKSKMVFEVDFSSAILIPFAKNLIKKHPENWNEILRTVLSNDSIYNLMILKLNADSVICKKPKTRVKPKTEKEVELQKKLLS